MPAGASSFIPIAGLQVRFVKIESITKKSGIKMDEMLGTERKLQSCLILTNITQEDGDK